MCCRLSRENNKYSHRVPYLRHFSSVPNKYFEITYSETWRVLEGSSILARGATTGTTLRLHHFHTASNMEEQSQPTVLKVRVNNLDKRLDDKKLKKILKELNVPFSKVKKVHNLNFGVLTFEV